MCAAVKNIHHGNGQAVCVRTAEESVERHAVSLSSGLCGGDGNCQDGVGAEIGLVLRTVSLEHGCIDRIHISSVEADDGVGDDRIYVLNCLEDALASETALVAVAKLESFELTGGCAAG